MMVYFYPILLIKWKTGYPQRRQVYHHIQVGVSDVTPEGVLVHITLYHHITLLSVDEI